jgi:hypothetical protein
LGNLLRGGINGDQATCGRGSSYLINPGQYVDFKVTNIPGTSNFNLYADWGSGWVGIATCNNTFSHGNAMGETGRFGGAATGASDYHKNLQYKNASGTWLAWPDNFETNCGNPCLSNWHYYRCTPTYYRVIKDGNPNTC